MVAETNLLTVVVVKKVPLTQDVYLFSFERPDNTQPDLLPEFLAGAHIDVYINEYIRQYSLCNTPGKNKRYDIAVLKDSNSRGGSVAMHEQLNEGDCIQISYPRNQFELHKAPHSVLLAGGIGITPLLAMAKTLYAEKQSFELHYYCSSKERTAFEEQLRHSPYQAHVHFHRDNIPEEKLSIEDLLSSVPEASYIYFCGPSGFIERIQAVAQNLNIDTSHLHFERFAASPEQLAASKEGAFTVKIQSTGQLVEIPAGVSIVEALSAVGINIPVSCEQGVCGTCITGVLEGEIEHHDQYFTEEEQARNDQMTPCCSRAKSNMLVLDL